MKTWNIRAVRPVASHPLRKTRNVVTGLFSQWLFRTLGAKRVGDDFPSPNGGAHHASGSDGQVIRVARASPRALGPVACEPVVAILGRFLDGACLQAVLELDTRIFVLRK